MSHLTESNLYTISVNDLCYGANKVPYHFFIPSYQRGYRWDTMQVKQLLDDLWEFHCKENKKSGEYYCLQPIVVKQMDEAENRWEVIDGQQRLTTVFILLQYLYKNEEKNPIFDFYFQRDKNDERKSALLSIENTDCKLMDVHYFKNTYEQIIGWFDKKKAKLQDSSLKGQLQTIVSKKTRFIWYSVPPQTDGRKTFRNINAGKIALTDSELIKAIYLNESNFVPQEATIIRMEQERIARLWDDVERTLQRESFWTFIGGKEYDKKHLHSTRIDYLFDLILPKDSTLQGKPFEIFYRFEKIKEQKNNIWKKIRELYRTFCDWSEDVITQNYIGYLTKYGIAIDKIIKTYTDKRKTDFKNWLRGEVSNIAEKVGTVDELDYSDSRDREKIIKVLLAHNVVSANKREEHFDFSPEFDAKWSIEHINLQCQNNNHTLYEEPDHNIRNLALISQPNNSSLSNESFWKKRQSIIDWLNDGKKLPICTVNAFMKFYSGGNIQLEKWEDADAEAYLVSIKQALTELKG